MRGVRGERCESEERARSEESDGPTWSTVVSIVSRSPETSHIPVGVSSTWPHRTTTMRTRWECKERKGGHENEKAETNKKNEMRNARCAHTDVSTPMRLVKSVTVAGPHLPRAGHHNGSHNGLCTTSCCHAGAREPSMRRAPPVVALVGPGQRDAEGGDAAEERRVAHLRVVMVMVRPPPYSPML